MIDKIKQLPGDQRADLRQMREEEWPTSPERLGEIEAIADERLGKQAEEESLV